MGERIKAVHGFGPVFDKDSRILILGSFPSVVSREQGFFYMNPQNRFFPVLSALLKEPIPQGVEERREFLLRHRIALYDVIESCSISNSSDSSIRDVVAADIDRILKEAPRIGAIFTNGSLASKLFKKYFRYDYISLPSTSSANARMRMEELIESYGVILRYLER